MKKQLLLFVMIILPIVANAFSGEVEIDGIKYYIVTKARSAEIRANNYSGDIVIPSSVTYEGVVCNVDKIGDNAFADCTSLFSVEVPSSINSIGANAFRNCNKLTSIILPSSISTIGNYAFAGCTALNALIIPSSLNSIEEGTFCGCAGLTSLEIPSTITKIGQKAFKDCTGLTSVIIPSSITRIEDTTFYNCTKLTKVIIPSSVIYIGFMAFQNCTDLIYVNLPESIEYIGANAFAGSGLKTMKLPSSISNIGKYTFAGCKSLTSLVLSSNINGIDMFAFTNCPELTDVYCYAIKAPGVGFGAFMGSEINYSTLHVPENSIEAYKNQDPWKDFKEIIKLMPMFALSYIINDEVYISYQVEEGTSITDEYEPKKEGYTFCALTEVPETMPANDVTVTGTFNINSYKLIYTVDGEIYKSYDIEYGATIIPESEPTKEGYTFSGWSEIPEKMPAHDVTVSGTFSINSYKLTYVVDGEIYKSYDIEYGATIIPESEPTKEGYTFSGWSEIPEKMPAHDVTVSGTFSINSYKLTYVVDGEIYKSYDIEYGATIIPESEPTKEGYTFSGWSEIPETMPAYDVTVTGSFSINIYKLTYMVDGVEHKSYDIEYGATITPEAEPTKEGYTFSGWSEIPQTMPAHDVTISGSFSINNYKLTYKIDDKVYKETMYEYGATIVPEPQPEGDYNTFEWLGLPQTMPAHDVVVNASYTITGIIEMLMSQQQNIRIYSPNGKMLNKPQKGLNIIHYNDGSIRKVVLN